ncbi:MAG TPA: GNAT family N-acetyltransferase [Egibacteraceae bacterium]|nr:GNAT family N-acetyltransferase [Egibacteraceae bacterium]
MDDIRVQRLDDPVSRELISQLLADLRERYGWDDLGEAEPEEFVPPRGTFVVGRRDGRAVACGGVRAYEGRTGEIKRMYVAPESRGKGFGRQILAELERFAVEAGYDALRLETGVLQPEAIGLYVASGYEQIPNYGIYADEPSSVCYAKRLTAE